MRRGLGIAVLCAVALTVTACGSSGSSSTSSSGGSSSGGSSSGSSASVSGAKVLAASALNNPPKGTITYCSGKDTTGAAAYVVAQFNAKYGAQGYHANLVQFPASADQQRAQFIQRQQAKSGSCDVFSSDVIWTAEFSSQKWLYDLTPYVTANASKFIAAPLDTVHYGGKYWGVPQTSDAAFIYYKTGEAVPSTWQQVYADAKKSGGIVYQGAPYEGLTCDFLELAFAAGGQVLSADGKKSAINSPQNLAALELMVNGVKGGSAPQAVTTYMEPETDQAFDTGKYGYMRNWTYAYAIHNTGALKGKLHAAPLPTFAGAGKAASPRRPQQRHQRVLEGSGPRAQVRRLLRLPGAAEGADPQVLARGHHPVGLQGPGRPEGGPVRAAASPGADAGEGAAGFAGVPADLAGHLHERQQCTCRSREPAGGAEGGGLTDQLGPLDVLAIMATVANNVGAPAPTRRRSKAFPRSDWPCSWSRPR